MRHHGHRGILEDGRSLSAPPLGVRSEAHAQSLMRAPTMARRRAVLCTALLTATASLAPLSVLAAWASSITEPGALTAAMTPLARNPVVIDYLSQRAAAAATRDLDVEHRLHAQLPLLLEPLAPSLTRDVTAGLSRVLSSALRTAPVRDVLVGELRSLNVTVADMLTDPAQPPSLSVTIRAPLGQAIRALDVLGIHSLDRLRTAAPLQVQVTLVNARQLGGLRWLVINAARLRWFLYVGLALAAIGAVLVAPRRWRALLALGGGVAGACGVAALVVVLWPDTVSSTATTPSSVVRLLERAVTSSLLRRFLDAAIASAGATLLVWLVGPFRSSIVLRRRAASIVAVDPRHRHVPRRQPR